MHRVRRTVLAVRSDVAIDTNLWDADSGTASDEQTVQCVEKVASEEPVASEMSVHTYQTIWRHLRESEKRKSHTAYSCSYKFHSYTILKFINPWSTQISGRDPSSAEV
jgi:hypothetical protein